MENQSFYGKAYMPQSFFSRLTRDVFNKPSDYTSTRVSYPWLIRVYKLFEATRDWLVKNKGQTIDTVTLINAWSLSDNIAKGPFNADTGRLISSNSLQYIKTLNRTVSDADLTAMYSDISKVLKRWDEWFLSSVGNQVQGAVSQLAPIGQTYARILVGTEYYAYGVDPGIRMPVTIDPVVGKVYTVSYMEGRDESFEAVRILNNGGIINNGSTQINAPIIKSDLPSPNNVGSDLVIDGPINLSTLAEFKEAKDTGRSVTIKGFSSAVSAQNKAISADETAAQKAVNDEVSRTPILDWLNDSSGTPTPDTGPEADAR